MSLAKLGQSIIKYVVDNKYKILKKVVDLATSRFNLSKDIVSKITSVATSGNIDPVVINNLKEQLKAFAESKITEELLNQVNKQDINFKSFCPSKDLLLKLIKIRNTLVETLSGIKKKGELITTTTDPLKITLDTLSTTATALLVAPIPIPPGTPIGVINTASDTLKTIKDKSRTLGLQLNSLSEIKDYIDSSVDQILNVLKLLDILIELCADKISKDEASLAGDGVETETGTGTGTGTGIGTGVGTGVGVGTGTNVSSGNAGGTGANNLLINNLLNLEDSGLIKKLQSSTPNSDNTYKGFKLEILLDDKNDLRFPKRYAVAKTPNGVIVLRTESSFASSVNVLLEEIKFIIDRDNLKI